MYEMLRVALLVGLNILDKMIPFWLWSWFPTMEEWSTCSTWTLLLLDSIHCWAIYRRRWAPSCRLWWPLSNIVELYYCWIVYIVEHCDIKQFSTCIPPWPQPMLLLPPSQLAKLMRLLGGQCQRASCPHEMRSESSEGNAASYEGSQSTVGTIASNWEPTDGPVLLPNTMHLHSTSVPSFCRFTTLGTSG